MSKIDYPLRNILGIPIASLSLIDIPQVVTSLIASPGKKTFFYVNAHCLNLARQDKDYCQILQKASFVYSGGVGPVLASIILNQPLRERTPSPDFIETVLALAPEKKWSLYLLGASDNSLKKVTKMWQKRIPGLPIIGCHSGYFTEQEEKQIIKEINQLKPTILLVGMGAPKQEKWVTANFSKLNVKTFWTIGAMFDVLAGVLPRAPLWIQKLNLEWAYRLFQEPRRLWKRYLFGNIIFIFSILKEKLKNG